MTIRILPDITDAGTCSGCGAIPDERTGDCPCSDLDARLAAIPPAPESAVTVTPPRARCVRHPRDRRTRHEDGTVTCDRCGATIDPERMRKGKAAVRRSKREERRLAADQGGIRTGHHGGPDDVLVGDMFTEQSKAGTGWWSRRYAAELDKLPRSGGRIPVLILSNGAPGRNVRRMVVVDYRDWLDLHGPEGKR